MSSFELVGQHEKLARLAKESSKKGSIGAPDNSVFLDRFSVSASSVRDQRAKLKQQREAHEASCAQAQHAPIWAKPPHVLADAVYFRGAADSKQKPLLRHVIVKDLNKVARQLEFEMPVAGIFKNKAPMAMYAVFDGTAGLGTAGPVSVEFCARNFHSTLLAGLANVGKATSMLAGAVGPAGRAEMTTAKLVEAALGQSLVALDAELLAKNPEAEDGCGAAVALLVGEQLFLAVVGSCTAILCVTTAQGKDGSSDAKNSAISLGGTAPAVHSSLGDRLTKASAGGAGTCTPRVQSFVLAGVERHPFFCLASATVLKNFSTADILVVAEGFPLQPRAFCGEVATRASEYVAMGGTGSMPACTVLQVNFLPDASTVQAAAPAAKKAKLSSSSSGNSGSTSSSGSQIMSMRLRHILVKFHEGPKPHPDPKCKWASRSRPDAEKMLRKAIIEIRQDQKEWPKAPKDLTELIFLSSKKFTQLARQLSDCQTALKGPPSCGELGWLTQEDRARKGEQFKELCDVLQPGHWSDIVATTEGLHLVQRVA